MSKSLFPNDGTLWSIRTYDISGNYGQKIDLSNNNAINFQTNGTNRFRITDSSSIFLNILDLSGNNLVNTLSVASQNNQNITIEGMGTGDVILKTGNTDRISILDTGVINFQGGMSYNNATNTLTATTFSGNLSGNASTATTATNATNATNVDINDYVGVGTLTYPVFSTSTIGNTPLKIDTAGLTFNPSTNTLTTSTFSGDLSGTATNATNVAITTDDTAGTYYIPFAKTSGTGNKALFIDDTTTRLSYNPSTSTLTATTFVGALSGNATTATTATNATNVDINNYVGVGTLTYPVFSTTTSGNNDLKIDNSGTGLKYNPSFNILTTGTFNGDLSGNATSATNIAGGAGGSIPYQSALNTTALLANGSSGQVLTSNGGTSAPSWTTISTTNQFILSGSAQNVNNNNTYYFGFPSGGIGATNASTTESAVQNTIPFDTTLSKWYIRLSVNAGTTGNGWTFTIRKNGVNTLLTITITGATTTGSDLTDSVSFSAGDLFSVSAVRVGTPNNVDLCWSCKGS